MSFSLANLDLRYEPFPIGVAWPIMDEAAYLRYLDRYPPIELFEYIPKVGNKYRLSEKYHPEKYTTGSRATSCWREFHRWANRRTSSSWCSTSWPGAWSTSDSSDARPPSSCSAACAGCWLAAGGRARTGSRRGSSSRCSRADSGSVTPHTDNPDKIITMVVSMARPGEWDPPSAAAPKSIGIGCPSATQPDQRQGRVRGHGAPGRLRVRAQSVRRVRQDLQLLAFRAADGRPGPQAMRRSPTINIEHEH